MITDKRLRSRGYTTTVDSVPSTEASVSVSFVRPTSYLDFRSVSSPFFLPSTADEYLRHHGVEAAIVQAVAQVVHQEEILVEVVVLVV